METIKITLPTDLEKIELHTFADLHIGDANCDLKEIKERIEYIKNNKNAYVILNGDLINNATKNSLSDVYTETMTPMQEIEYCVKLLSPIKDKILCITSGNHERRSIKDDGVDLDKIVSIELGCADKYALEGALIFLRFGNNPKRNRRQWYSIYVTHGSGGGRKEGSKVNRLADMASIIDADIYIHSHTHLPVIMKENFYRTDAINSSVSLVEKLFINTSSELKYGGYGQIGEYKPNSTACPIIYISGTDKSFTALL